MSEQRYKRIVRLAPGASLAKADLQVNYYNFLERKLFRSTEVWLGDRLIYSTNALGCRGDEIDPQVPLVGVFGGDLVHGGLEGSFVEEVRLAGCQVLNGGAEDLTFEQAAARAKALAAAAPMLAAVVVPPAPAGGGPAEWRAALDAIRGPAFLAIALSGEGDAEFNQFLKDYARGAGRLLIEPQAGGGLRSLGRKLLGGERHPLAAAISQQVARPVADWLKANSWPPVSQGLQEADAPMFKGASAEGSVYPLW